ncbi:MAG: acyl-CoA dehydrogenase [Pseudomonadota bacterium]
MLFAGQLITPAALAVILVLALLYVLVWGAGPIRRRLISAPLLRQFRKVLPPLSTTEQQALDAGSVWWDGELFSGRPDWEQLLATPPAELSAEEQAFMDGPLETLCNMIDDWKICYYDHDLPTDIWDHIKEKRFFGMIIPQAYGGLEFSAYAHSQVVMKLASRSITAAVTVMVPNSLGPGKLLLHYGTEAQKAYYLPKLAAGEEIPCFALTGPKAGSDAGAIPDNGIVCQGVWNGRQTLGVRLNWEKRYITLGPIATLIGLAFKLHDPDHLLGERESLGITVALIPRETPGVEIGKRHIPLDIPFQNGPNRGRDVFVPIEQIIGGEEGIGRGWKMLVESLAEGRGISLPSLATGAAKSAARYSGAYARIRRQFNLPIGRFEGIQEALARIAGYAYQADAARKLTLSGIDQGERPSVITAIVKYHLTERYRQVINDAMDIQGGSGICLGPSNLTGRSYQAIPISITVEGANILTRSMIIFGQGAVRSHPWVLKEFQAVSEPDHDKALADFDHALLGHAGYMVANIARSLLLGLTRGRFSKAPAAAQTERAYYQHLNWMSAAFALCADTAMMTLGGTLKRRERLSARLGDVLSELYLSSAVLKRFHDEGRQHDDLPLLQWSMEQSLYNMQQSLHALMRNLTPRPLAWALRLLVFPTGSPFHAPDDRSDSRTANLLLAPSDVRDRLTDGIFITTDTSEPVGQLEAALALSVKLEAVEKTIAAARKERQIEGATAEELFHAAHAEGLIDEQQLDDLQRLEKLRSKVIAVDAFSDWGEQFALGEKRDEEAA